MLWVTSSGILPYRKYTSALSNLWLLQSSHLHLLQWSLSLEGGYRCPFCGWIPPPHTYTYILHFDCLWVSAFTNIHCMKNLLWCRLRAGLWGSEIPFKGMPPKTDLPPIFHPSSATPMIKTFGIEPLSIFLKVQIIGPPCGESINTVVLQPRTLGPVCFSLNKGSNCGCFSHSRAKRPSSKNLPSTKLTISKVGYVCPPLKSASYKKLTGHSS